MNADKEESLTSQSPQSSENSSSPSGSSPETPSLLTETNSPPFEDFETAPLRGLLEKAMDEMSLDELRERVMRIRQLRTPQVFKAEVEAETRQAKDKPSAAKLARQAEAFGDLL
jgi:hypothetical protein